MDGTAHSRYRTDLMAELPTGTVTFLFTDIEGSTRLLRRLGEAYAPLQDEHASIMRDAIALGSGVEIRTEGDAFFAVFPTPGGAVRAAVTAQRGLASHPWPDGSEVRVRMGMHSGDGVLGGDDYVGIDVNRAARIAATGHGGQIVISEPTRALLADSLPEGVAFRDLGVHRLKDFDRAEHLHDLAIDGLDTELPGAALARCAANEPAHAAIVLRRQSDRDRGGRSPAGRHPPAHADGSRRHGQDPARAPGRLGTARPSSRRRVLRRPRSGERSDARDRRDRQGSAGSGGDR